MLIFAVRSARKAPPSDHSDFSVTITSTDTFSSLDTSTQVIEGEAMGASNNVKSLSASQQIGVSVKEPFYQLRHYLKVILKEGENKTTTFTTNKHTRKELLCHSIIYNKLKTSESSKSAYNKFQSHALEKPESCNKSQPSIHIFATDE